MINKSYMYKYLVKPILFRFPADYTHETTVKLASSVSRNKMFLKASGSIYKFSDSRLKQNIFGLNFPNPVGLAAGFDKNGTLCPLLEKIGFGFVEVGSITAKPSVGNPKPRSFRLPDDESLINRLGLNNEGVQTVSRRLKKLNLNIPLGINIAKTNDPSITGKAAIQDYKISFDKVKSIADYITLNISCPNTEEGKTFEDPDVLDSLLTALNINKDSSLPAILVKVSADLKDNQLAELITVCEHHAVDGYVATNTSSLREGLKTSPELIKNLGRGGLSGKAIKNKSTAIIEKIFSQTKGEKTIIGVGGISDGNDAIDKLKAGADLLQIYTGLIYEGPAIVKKINQQLVEYLKKHGKDHIYHIRKQ